MQKKYDLNELLENPDAPLTKEQYENFDRYMAMTNDDKSAEGVDISGGVDERINEMKTMGTFWR